MLLEWTNGRVRKLTRSAAPVVCFVVVGFLFVTFTNRTHTTPQDHINDDDIIDYDCLEIPPVQDGPPVQEESPQHQRPSQNITVQSQVKETPVRAEDSPNSTVIGACKFQRSVFYLKIHKTASSTINTILDRVVTNHGLKQVPVVDNPWPKSDLVPFVMKQPSGSQELGTYNVFSDHYIYNEKSVERVMAPDTVYVASIRFPLTQLRSVFDEFFLAKTFGITAEDPVAYFLKNLSKYGEKNIYTRSLHARTFGLDKSKFNNKEAIRDLISFIERKFKVVMVTEYFTESLVLWRRRMCWEMSDMIYLAQRVNTKSKHKYKMLDWSLEEAHRKYSFADYEIYDHFTAKLLNEIQSEPYFWNEVDTLKRIMKQLATFCQPILDRLKTDVKEIYDIEKENKSITFNPHPWGAPFKVYSGECAVMKLDTVILRNNIKVRQNPDFCSSRVKRTVQKGSLYINVKWDAKRNSVIIHEKYCDKMHPIFKIPMAVLADKSAYMWLDRT